MSRSNQYIGMHKKAREFYNHLKQTGTVSKAEYIIAYQAFGDDPITGRVFDIVFPTVGIDADSRFRADEGCPRAHGIALPTDENTVGRSENRAVGLERGERENGFFGLLGLCKSHCDGQRIEKGCDDSFHIILLY